MRRRISLTGQHVALDKLLTGEENLRLIARLRRLGAREARTRTAGLLARFDLEEAAGRRVATYSAACATASTWPRACSASPRSCSWGRADDRAQPRRLRQGLWEVVQGLAADGTTIF